MQPAVVKFDTVKSESNEGQLCCDIVAVLQSFWAFCLGAILLLSG